MLLVHNVVHVWSYYRTNLSNKLINNNTITKVLVSNLSMASERLPQKQFHLNEDTDFDEIELLLKEARGRCNYDLLQQAIIVNNSNAVAYLLMKGKYPEYHHPKCNNYLHLACRLGRVSMVKTIIEVLSINHVEFVDLRKLLHVLFYILNFSVGQMTSLPWAEFVIPMNAIMMTQRMVGPHNQFLDSWL